MISMWTRLSPFTRLLAVVVVVAALAGGYTRLRFKPQHAELVEARKVEKELRSEVRKARQRVDRLEQEAHLAQRWSHFASILEDQSTGKSLREIVRTCGTDEGPDVEVEVADFQRQARGENFARMAVSLTVRGSYGELIELLDELDRAFPPIEIHKATLERSVTTESDAGRGESDVVVARLDGVIHETH